MNERKNTKKENRIKDVKKWLPIFFTAAINAFIFYMLSPLSKVTLFLLSIFYIF